MVDRRGERDLTAVSQDSIDVNLDLEDVMVVPGS